MTDWIELIIIIIIIIITILSSNAGLNYCITGVMKLRRIK
jgi:choline-glycine betaine transporter